MQQDARVHYYRHSQNIGSFNNFNFGISRVDTPYFSVLSDDDVLLPDFYEKALDGFKKYPEAIFTATRTLVVKDEKIVDVLFADYEEKLYRPPVGLLKIAEGRTNTWTGTLYRREVLTQIQLDEKLSQGPAEQDFLFRIATIFSYTVVRSVGAIFVVHAGAVSDSRREVDVIEEYRQFLDKVQANTNIPQEVRDQVCQKAKSIIADSLWAGGWIDIKRRNFARARLIARSLKDDFGQNQRSVVLVYGVWLCVAIPLFYYVFLGLNQIRKWLTSTLLVKERRLQSEYGTYLQYLEGFKLTS